MTIAPFKLLSATTSAAAPFCLGHAFVQGEVPSGSQLAAGSVQLQCVAKNAWPDGSLKYAVLAGVASITGGVDLSVTPAIGSPVTSTALALSDLKATGVTASIVSSVAGTVAWATTDWDGPFEQWVSGPVMSSWVYRKAVGTDVHLVGWLEVRLWAGGKVEILPWIENGYLNVASPTNKSATYSFNLGGTERMSEAIDLKHHQRTPLVSGSALSYWLGTDPGVTPLHDSAYLQSSELVPSYRAVMAVGGGRISVQPTTFTPLQQGSFNYDGDSMPSSGYQTPIGLLPEHDVLHLVANAADRVITYNGVIRNGYSAGRYGIHYRDESTQRPPAFSDYPTMVYDSASIQDAGASTTSTYTPAATGGNSPKWDTAHSPNVGYLAYLLTGRFYFKEEVQFAATTNHFAVTDWVRGGGIAGDFSPFPTYTGASGICVGAVQTRSAAWWFRSLTQALAVTPDAGDAMRSEFITVIEENCRYFHAMYVAQANNPFGMIAGAEGSYGDIAGKYTVPVWQQDFVTMAWGQALCLGLPISSTASTKMAAFFQWKAKSIVSRLGTSADWWYVNAAPYTMPIGPSTTADFSGGTGPWLADAKAAYDIYAAAHSVDSAMSTTEGVLGQDYPASSQPSMWHNLQPAISYAVRHGVPGAVTAYDRMTGASNWPDIETVFNSKPVWSVAPASIGTPVMTTPGPKMRVGQLLAGKMAVSGFRGTGITPAQNATGGDNPSLLAQHMVGADPTSEFLWVADDVPAGLDLVIYEDSSAIATAADGAYNGNKTVYTDGAGSAGTYSFTLGTPTSEITGVSITPTTATGATTFSATVSGTGSFSNAKTFSKISGGGSIDPSTGVFTPPAQTGSVQTIVVRATSTQDPTWHAEATITIAAGTSTVTGVTVTPSTATINEGSTIDLDATVAGLFSPSQAVNWTTNLGTVNASGVLTAPAGVATVTATSQQDGTRSGFGTITIAAVTSSLTARTVTLTLGDTAGVCANLTGVKVAFYDEASPELQTTARYQSAIETTDASGVLTFSVNSTLASGGTGCISVLMPDGRNYLQPQAVS